jgi:hypothetical protein
MNADFFFPGVPNDKALAAFDKVGKEMGVI